MLATTDDDSVSLSVSNRAIITLPLMTPFDARFPPRCHEVHRRVPFPALRHGRLHDVSPLEGEAQDERFDLRVSTDDQPKRRNQTGNQSRRRASGMGAIQP